MNGAYSKLFDRIISGDFQPGDHLREQDIADELGVSRTPVREAVRQLVEDGLVDFVPKRGARVVGFTVDDVEEIYDIRLSLELLALKYAEQLISLQRLKEIRADIVAAAASDDCPVHEDIDTRLHNYIIETSGKRRIISILNRMLRLVQNFRSLGFREEAVRRLATEEHLAFVDALSTRDSERAQATLKNHIERSKANAISQLVRGEVP